MKKVVFSMMTMLGLMFGLATTNAAHSTDKLTVRFDENTLVVTSTQLEEAGIYTLQGKMLQQGQGKLIQFPLEKGTYRLFATVNGATVTRRIELK